MKRTAPPAAQPPPADSSDDEEDSSAESMGSEEGEESSDSEQLNETQRKAPPPKLSSAPPPRTNPPPQRSVSSSGSESESDSDTDSGVPIGTKAPQTQPKAQANPMATNPSESESDSDSDDLPPTARNPQLKLNQKRPRETTSAAEVVIKTPLKKSNVAGSQSSQKTGEESSKKPTPFQRVWSDEDEVALLGGMVEFWSKKSLDPSSNITAFHEFIKDRLHLDVVPAQLANKMRSCKKKFFNNEKRSKNGKDRPFAKATEQRAFDISKKLWSSEEGILKETPVTKAKANGTASKKKQPAEKLSLAMPDSLLTVKAEDRMDEFRHKDGILLSLCHSELSHFSNGRVDDEFVKLGVDLISDSKRKDLEERWKKLNLAEMQILSERALLIHEQTNQIIDAFKHSGGQ